jgi:hypothetical protein
VGNFVSFGNIARLAIKEGTYDRIRKIPGQEGARRARLLGHAMEVGKCTQHATDKRCDAIFSTHVGFEIGMGEGILDRDTLLGIECLKPKDRVSPRYTHNVI